MNFDDDEYQIKTVPKFFGAVDGRIFYKDTIIAEAFIDGSNYCDREGMLKIYIDVLKSVYKVTRTV